MEVQTQTPTIDQTQAAEIYKKALSFNVIGKYDPLIKQLLHLTSYSVIYKFETEVNDWVKTDFQGPLGIYSRGTKDESHNKVGESTNTDTQSVDDGKRYTAEQVLADDSIYSFGLIVMNRNNPTNFSIGLIKNSQLVPAAGEDDSPKIIVEKNGELVIIKTLNNETYGVWIFDANDRDYVYKVLKYCID